jgi:hypothetical protein
VKSEVDWEAFEKMYVRRAQGEDIKMSRDLQRNFQNPSAHQRRSFHPDCYHQLSAKPLVRFEMRASDEKLVSPIRTWQQRDLVSL